MENKNFTVTFSAPQYIEIERKGARTEVHFTHVGLVPTFECYDGCSRAWGHFVADSLRKRIAG